MNRRIVGTAVGGRSILCVVLSISYTKPLESPHIPRTEITFAQDKTPLWESICISTYNLSPSLGFGDSIIFSSSRRRLEPARHTLCLCVSLAEFIEAY
jgi:hypothetical protein